MKGDGSFRITPAGTVEYRFQYTDVNGEKKTKSVCGIDEYHCIARANEFKDAYYCNVVLRKQNSTIADILYDKYERDFKKNFIKESSYYRKIAMVSVIERSFLGYIPIARITTEHIDSYLELLTDYADSTIKIYYQMLQTAFWVAASEGIIQYNIMKESQLRRPGTSKKRKRVRGFSVSEQKKFVNALYHTKTYRGNSSFRLQLLIAMLTGMRMGEINALKPEDINFKNRYIHVERTIAVGKDEKSYLSNTTKTDAGDRDVPISCMLEPLLKEALNQMKDNSEGLLFYDYKRNDVISTSQTRYIFKKVCMEAGIPYYGQHALRHTFATRCIEAGVEAVVLKTWLGHKNIHTTLDTYTDVYESMNRGAISEYDAYMEKYLGIGNQADNGQKTT